LKIDIEFTLCIGFAGIQVLQTCSKIEGNYL